MRELNDNEIRVIGSDMAYSKRTLRRRWLVAIVAVLAALAVLAGCLWWASRKGDAPAVGTHAGALEGDAPAQGVAMEREAATAGLAARTVVVNDVPLVIYEPRNLRASLRVGPLPDEPVDSIVMALQAADLRADNLQIVSAFVRQGELLSRGTAKLGFCAIVGDSIMLGVDRATPYFELALNEGGDFFRQYPLVASGKVVENVIKNKAIRRALALIDRRVVVVVSQTRESMHDFAQALADTGAEVAVSLVGSKMSTGWIQLPDSLVRPEAADFIPASELPEQVNYIVWTK